MEQATLPPSPPQTPSGSSEEGGSGGDFSKVNLFKRVAAPLMPRSARSPCEAYEIREKPLPRLPTQTVFSDTCTLQTSMCIGFPKRPRQQSEGKNHPSLDTQSSLPDGLLKTKMLLDRQMLPSIDWAGLSVKVSKSVLHIPISLTFFDSITLMFLFLLDKKTCVPEFQYASFDSLLFDFSFACCSETALSKCALRSNLLRSQHHGPT